MISKLEARSRGRAVRAGLSPAQREASSAVIVSRVQETLDWPIYRRVMVFLPIERQREVDTWPLVRWLWEAWPEIQLYAPRMWEGHMTPVLITPKTQFEIGDFAIPEPQTSEVAVPGLEFDLIVTPLLAYDRAGHRVGYGGGHYDRFLAEQAQAQKVGLGYVACLVEEGIAVEAHDVALDKVISD